MLTDEEWKKIKEQWIADGRIPDDDGYYHFVIREGEKQVRLP